MTRQEIFDKLVGPLHEAYSNVLDANAGTIIPISMERITVALCTGEEYSITTIPAEATIDPDLRHHQMLSVNTKAQEMEADAIMYMILGMIAFEDVPEGVLPFFISYTYHRQDGTAEYWQFPFRLDTKDDSITWQEPQFGHDARFVTVDYWAWAKRNPDAKPIATRTINIKDLEQKPDPIGSQRKPKGVQ